MNISYVEKAIIVRALKCYIDEYGFTIGKSEYAGGEDVLKAKEILVRFQK